MRVEFRTSFVHDLKSIKDAALLSRIQAVIEAVEQAERLQDIANLIKLQGSGNHYRVRVGDYRVGLNVENNIVSFVRCLHRREVYKNFP